MKKYIIGIIGLILIGFGGFVYANPQYFVGIKSTNTSNATTTVAYMTPGTGTTTLTFDSKLVNQNNSSQGSNPTVLEKLNLFVQLTATTGQPTLNIEIEDSRDGIDWYRRTLDRKASTTNPFLATEIDKIQFYFASTTATEGGLGVSNTESLMNMSFEITPRAEFIRALFYLSSTTLVSTRNDDGSIYAEFAPTKERNY